MKYPKEFSLERVTRGVLWGLTPTLVLGFWFATTPLGGNVVSVPRSAIEEGSADPVPSPAGLADPSQEASPR